MYLAEIIDEVLESKKDRIIGSPSYSYLCYELTAAFALKDPYFFRYETYEEYGIEDYAISGLYDMGKDTKHIIFNFSSEQSQFAISEEKWKEMRFAISQVCQHESIHQCQWQLRDPDAYELEPLEFRSVSSTIDEEQAYLSDADEIDAYAHDIAMEIKYYYPKKNPYKVLSSLTRHRKVWSYSYYKKTFKGQDWSHIKKRLLKKTFQWIPHIK